jgi:hypothetical protein
LTGEPLQPILPDTGPALLAGEISAAHADVIGRYTDQVDRLPDAHPDDARIAEKVLLEASRHEAPKMVERLGQTLLTRLDADGTEPSDERIERKRSFTLRTNADGSSEWKVFADAELTAMIESVLDSLAGPQRDKKVNGSDQGDGAGGAQAADDLLDERTPTQRRHDALRDSLRRVLRSGDLPVAGGTPNTVIAHVRFDQLKPTGSFSPDAFEWEGTPEIVAGVEQHIAEQVRVAREAGSETSDGEHGCCDGYAVTSHGGLLSGRQLAIDLCEAELDIVVTSPDGAVLAFGRSVRLATRAQRIALAARDGGCSFPGCTRPPSWCEAHHVIPWLDGGPTDLNNLCLVCPFHHRRFEKLNWSVRMNNGVPEWIPPPWDDPERRPQRNTANHLLDYEFARRSI